MEPLSEERKQEILRNNPQATREAIEEYEKLLAREFTHDPDEPKSREGLAEGGGREQRIEELYHLLFPDNEQR